MARSAPISQARLALLGRAGGGDHLGAEGLGELDGGGADAAGAAVHQEPFAGRQAPALEHVVPYREEGLGHRARVHHVEACRNGQRDGLLGNAVLGVAAAVDERAHLVAELPARDARADGCHLAGDLEAGQRRVARRRRIEPGALHEVGTVDAGRGHLDQDLAGRRLGRGHGLRLQDLGPAGRGDLDRRHRLGHAGHGSAPSDWHLLAARLARCRGLRQEASRATLAATFDQTRSGSCQRHRRKS